MTMGTMLLIGFLCFAIPILFFESELWDRIYRRMLERRTRRNRKKWKKEVRKRGMAKS